ncbi:MULTISPECIES: hypothetical protein [unclassified Streptomyces]|uniref:hypothetical protein n=1 Tax=unclassified Streptomyces TaxID=2593676 RepID=UPI00228634B5|nr:hypothetical protein [Streptomyces sp. Je 1-369]WAL97919.1 hypothetical protein NOO62_27580 [Streptomyces sp. Je 1-369]
MAVLFGTFSGVSYAESSKACDESWDDNGVNCTIRHWNDHVNGTLASKGSFTSYDEVVAASDHYADGLGVYIKAEDSYTGQYIEKWVTGGKGDSWKKNASFPDGRFIDLKVCQTNNGTLMNCLFAEARA